jgi:hypothetical protein
MPHPPPRKTGLITHLPAAYGPWPWSWRRSRSASYPPPLWALLWDRRRPAWMMRRKHPGFCRSSPVMRRYRTWSEQRRAAIFAEADHVSVT